MKTPKDAIKMNKYICPHCGNEVYKTESDGYFAQCFNCDEDFYKFELNNLK
jgi:hypothetical protein